MYKSYEEALLKGQELAGAIEEIVGDEVIVTVGVKAKKDEDEEEDKSTVYVPDIIIGLRL